MVAARPTDPKRANGGRDGRARLAWWTLALALIAGGVLRSIWIEDMEWKADEQWSYRVSREVGHSRPWPAVGMPTSLGFPNPGLSAWLFVPLGRFATTPTAMARVVVGLNVLALVGFAAAVRAGLPPEGREPWIWGLALQAVSPFAIRVSRKIWPPSLLPPWLLLLGIGQRLRRTRGGAFAWGLAGALIGQVHLSGWLVASGLVLGTAVAEWWARPSERCRWPWWLLGTALGLVPALPWAIAMPWPTLSRAPGAVVSTALSHAPSHLYGLVATASSALPFAVLGLGLESRAFDAGPILDGIPTHLPELVRHFLVAVVVARASVRLFGAVVATGLPWARRRPAPGPVREASADVAAARPGGPCDSVAFYAWSTIAIPSVLYLLIVKVYFYHYYYIMYPFLFVLVAAYLLPWRRVLVAVVLAQALLAYAFLSYIHREGGALRGDYGISYARQRGPSRPAPGPPGGPDQSPWKFKG